MSNPAVGNAIGLYSQALTVTASSAYATGNVVGQLCAIAASTRPYEVSGLIQSVQLASASAQTSQLFDVIFFNANPTNSVFVDKTALAIAAADVKKIVGIIHCTDVTSTGTGTSAQALQCALPFNLGTSGQTLYAVVVSRGTPTFTASTDLSLYVGIYQD